MKALVVSALALLLSGNAMAADLSISLSSDESKAALGPRHSAREARVAISSRDRSTTLLLLDDVIAVQLSDAELAKMSAETKSKSEEPGFLEEFLIAGVKLAVGKSVEYPTEHIRSIEFRDGALKIVNDQNKPVFTELKVNGTEILRDFSREDAVRFAAAFNARRR
jgi:hypothetical protein